MRHLAPPLAAGFRTDTVYDVLNTDSVQILRAKFVAPISHPIIENGAIAVRDGTILNVGEFETIRVTHPTEFVIDFGDAVILPGLVNAHVHLELSTLSCSEQPRESFAKWLLARAKATRSGAIDATEAATLGIAQCLKFGVTCVGDITQQYRTTRAVLSKSPLRGVSFGEVLGIGNRKSRFDELFDELMLVAAGVTGPNVISGLSPHAPYSVDLPGYRRCVEKARALALPIATHLAESADERTFLEHHDGPFRELLNTLGSWRDDIETFKGSPIEMADAIGLLKMNSALLAHVNYCDDAELDLLAAGRASVVYCPRTHAYFGHPPHRWREMLDRKINVAIGTDSCASSPNLNLVDDLRLLRKIAPEMSRETLWEMATINGAWALSLDDQIGTLEAGKRADFAVFPADSGNPLETILQEKIDPISVWVGGVNLKSTG